MQVIFRNPLQVACECGWEHTSKFELSPDEAQEIGLQHILENHPEDSFVVAKKYITVVQQERTARQERIDEALIELLDAINNAGPHPLAHFEIMNKSRREWPTLWKAIDKLLANGVKRNVR